MKVVLPTRVLVLAMACLAPGCGARTGLTEVQGSTVADASIDAATDGAVDSRDTLPGEREVAPPPRVLAWHRLALSSKAGPRSRMDHFAVLDPATRSLVVFGGWDPYDRTGGEPPGRDVWRMDLDLQEWTRVGTLSRPLVRNRGAAMLDAPRNRIVVVANGDSGSETLAIDMTTWKDAPLAAGPWPRGFSVMAGGSTTSPSALVASFATYDRLVDATWIFDPSAGSWATVAGPGPKPRGHTELASDGVGGDVFLFSGYYGDPWYDLWRLEVGARRWTEVRTPTKLPARLDHASVVDATHGRLVVFGGSATASVVMEGLLLLDLKSGESTSPELTPGPEHRRDHSFTIDPVARRVYLFGGAFSSERCFDDTWALDLD